MTAATTSVMDADTYCREIEAHLCRRNAGHIVRVVGPAFEKVMAWVEAGIPIRVACAGIDRYFERKDRKPRARRRPVPLEFCEADVLDSFDEWRRAVGVGIAGGPAGAPEADESTGAASGRRSLRAHLDRVASRLTDRIAQGGLPPEMEARLGGLLERLARDREAARTVRGEARQALVAALEQLDEGLMSEVRGASEPGLLRELEADAGAELEGFRLRMPEAEYRRARDAAVVALLRERWRLPVISYP